ncbi:MAG: cytochrome c1 [Sphingopyxis sp.]|nr:cytochrome c1 [Sphingopyxis sp.]
MVRPVAMLAGLGFITALLLAIFTTPLTNEPNVMYSFVKKPRDVHLASDGMAPHWDTAQLQRGLKVYKEVCSACHGLSQVAFRNLADLGYDEGQIKAFAKGFQVASINPDTGEAATREGVAADKWPSPYPNEVGARAANNGAYPPDLSLITKAREDGKNYVYSLLTGYADPATYKNKDGKPLPKELMPSATLHFNPYFANLNIAMAQPLAIDDQVTFDDGTKASVDQMAKDVTAFLVWTAEPNQVTRVWAGWAVIGFLLIFTTLAFMSYKAIWADKKH